MDPDQFGYKILNNESLSLNGSSIIWPWLLSIGDQIGLFPIVFGDRQRSGLAEHIGTVGICPQLFVAGAMTLLQQGGALCFQIDFTRTFLHSKNPFFKKNLSKPPISLPPYAQWRFRIGGGEIKGHIKAKNSQIGMYYAGHLEKAAKFDSELTRENRVPN